tara:strand:- start:1823 stop:2170 length:348 start_codon:yes stop_codon:yes gene_type:complete
MDDNEIQSTLERASLLKDRWYLIFKQGSDEEHVTMTAYDTTDDDGDEEYVPAGTVILSGIVELMESDFDRVMQAGIARLQFEATKQAMIEETESSPDVTHDPNTNIVKINFGKTQ